MRLAAGALAALLAAPLPALAEPLVCTGNEPFWRLDIDGSRGQWWWVDGTAQGAVAEGVPGRLDLGGESLTGWRGPVTVPIAGELVAIVESGACQDTMADQRFPMTARLSMPDGRLLAGCCRTAGGPAQVPIGALMDRPAEDWSRHLAELLPVIEACYPLVSGAARVTKAWPMNRGMAGTRIESADGRRWDCIAPLAGNGIDSLRSLESAEPALPGEGLPVFVPGSVAVEPQGCSRFEQVVEPDGQVRGWLSVGRCATVAPIAPPTAETRPASPSRRGWALDPRTRLPPLPEQRPAN
jgi:hypothetical protein